MKRDARQEYLAAHIPGAVFFDINAIARHHDRSAAHAARRRGVLVGDAASSASATAITIVVYDGAGLFSARARVVDVAHLRRARGLHPRRRPAEMEGGGTPDRDSARSSARRAISRRVSITARGRETWPTCRRRSPTRARRWSMRAPRNVSAAPRRAASGPALRPHAGRVQRALCRSLMRGRPAGCAASGSRRPSRKPASILDKPIMTSCGSGVTAAILWLALDAHRQAAEEPL